MRTITDFCTDIGISPLSTALRAIDKNNLEHVWLVLGDAHDTRLYCTSTGLDDYDPDTTPVRRVGAGCIAWDGSDWEYGDETDYIDSSSITAVRQSCTDAYDEYRYRQYGALASYPGRSAEEDAEVQELLADMCSRGCDPGWLPVPIDPTLVEPPKTTTDTTGD